jgi:hypothetical protein
MFVKRNGRPSWRVADAPAISASVIVPAAVAIAMLLIEVGQSSRVAQICLSLEQTHAACTQAAARLDFARAERERGITRAGLAPMANRLGLVPADATQLMALPSEYLADGGSTPADEGSVPVLAWAERASRAIVPEATARSRASN